MALPLTITLMMTLHNRPPEVMRSVFSALKHFPGNQAYDELVLVNDRGDRRAIDTALGEVGLEARIVEVGGPPGYRGQAIAWNAGYRTIESSHCIAISSDCILNPWSVRTFRLWAEYLPDLLVYGKAVHSGKGFMARFNSDPPTYTKSVFSSRRGMPETYAWMAPMDKIRAIGGWDEEFSAGLCYDHTDLFYRIMKANYELVVCDDIVATHIEHKRDYMDEALVRRNHELFESKHGKYGAGSWYDEAKKRYSIGGVVMPPISVWSLIGRADPLWDDITAMFISGVYRDVLPLPFSVEEATQ